MIEEVNKKISEEVDIHNPYIVMKKIEQLSALMSNVVLLASDTKRSFDAAAASADDLVELSEEAYARDYCAGLKQAMQIRITSLQSILSYLKSELDAQR